MSQQQLPESNLAHSILFKVSLILLIALFINVITQIQNINIVESLTFNVYRTQNTRILQKITQIIRDLGLVFFAIKQTSLFSYKYN